MTPCAARIGALAQERETGTMAAQGEVTEANPQGEAQDLPVKPKSPILKQIATILIAAVFLYFAFRGANFSQIWNYSKSIDFMFFALVCVIGVISHLLRAIRWVVLLRPVSDKPVSLWNSFCAVLIGYAVNVVIPRGGEVARLVSISKSENIPWAAVLPTMFIDRLLDIALLVFVFGSTILVLPKSITEKMPWLFSGGIALTAATVVGLFLLPKIPACVRWFTAFPFIRRAIPEKIFQKVESLLTQFELGTGALTNPLAYPAIAGLSFLIWLCYFANSYFMLWAFHLQEKVSVLNALIVFAIGSLGVLIPTPGSVGSYHWLVKESLVMTSGLDPDLALAYATVLHITSFILVSCVTAAICVGVNAVRAQK